MLETKNNKRTDYIQISLNHFYRHTRGMTHEQIGIYILCWVEFVETNGKYSESIANAIQALLVERDIISDWQRHLDIINKHKSTNSLNGKRVQRQDGETIAKTKTIAFAKKKNGKKIAFAKKTMAKVWLI